MVLLDEHNVCAYLSEHYPAFSQAGPVKVHAIGGGDGEEGGLINYLFRVTNDEESIIVKQARSTSRTVEGLSIPTSRNRQEYESTYMRGAVVPQYVPKALFEDPENAVLAMEDVSYLTQAQSLLMRSRKIPLLGEQIGEYVARNSFYFSEFYLDTDEFRRLSCHFRNSDMRSIMESWVFLRDAPYLKHRGNMRLKALLDADEQVNARSYEMRLKFMTRGEALIHGDLHVGNIFADDTRLKVIDMEYTFAGPMCYDIGYFSASLLTQYFTGCFRKFDSERERQEFISYILATIATTYNSFVRHFVECWHKDAKPVYRKAEGLLQLLAKGFLADVLAFTAIPCFTKVTTNPTGEFVALGERDMERAQELCLIVCRQLLLHGDEFATIEDAMSAIVDMTSIYLSAH